MFTVGSPLMCIGLPGNMLICIEEVWLIPTFTLRNQVPLLALKNEASYKCSVEKKHSVLEDKIQYTYYILSLKIKKKYSFPENRRFSGHCLSDVKFVNVMQLTEIIKSKEAREKVLGVQDKIRTNTMSSTLTRNSSIRDFDMQHKDNKVSST